MPAQHNYVHGTCTICGDKAYTPGKWDGTLDFSWYDEANPQTSYTIYTEAEWEALAWICSEHLSELSELGAGTYTNGNVTKIVGTVPAKQNTFEGVSFKLANDLDFGGVKADDGTFRPDDAITREQIATILYRFDEATKADEDKLAGFPDAADVSGWAAEGLNWAVNEGLIDGVATQGTSYLQPKATATRVQIAAIIMRYLSSK